MTYCNQEIPNKDRRKRKQPSVSLLEIDAILRHNELDHYANHPEESMPILVKVNASDVKWPEKF